MGSRATYTLFLLCVLITLPRCAFAQVRINEVMYNPDGTDSGREWIELYNSGTTDALITGGSGKGSWRVSDGSNHTITDPSGGTGRGSLTISAGSYLILASDPDEFLGAYAGGTEAVAKSSLSLSNTGATVALFDGSGATVDSFAYSKEQGGSDDGSSLQRQSDGSWIAGAPTPGAQNTTTASGPPVTTSTDGATTSTQASAAAHTPAPVQSYVPPPVPQIFADGGDDRTVIVGADTEFDGRAYDRDETELDRVRFMWNFGDGSTAEGPFVLHHYSYPGRYLVVLTIAENREAVSDRIVVTAEPAALGFVANADGSVSIENRAGHDLDLSGWIVRSFAEVFTLPEHSIVLSGETLRIPQATLRFYAGSKTELEYPNGALAQVNTPENVYTDVYTPVSVTPHVSAASQTSLSKSGPKPSPRVVAGREIAAKTPPVSGSATPVVQTAAVANAAVFTGSWFWWLGALLLALFAAAAAVYAKHQKRGEWDIAEIED